MASNGTAADSARRDPERDGVRNDGGLPRGARRALWLALVITGLTLAAGDEAGRGTGFLPTHPTLFGLLSGLLAACTVVLALDRISRWLAGRRTDPRAEDSQHWSGPPYLHELAIEFTKTGVWDTALQRCWREKFHAVYFEAYGRRVPVAVAEVCPMRPPYDYPSQARLYKRTKIKEWMSWREIVVDTPGGAMYAELNVILRDIAALYLRATNYTDPEDAAFCHRVLRLALQECVDAYDAIGQPDGTTWRARLLSRLSRRLSAETAGDGTGVLVDPQARTVEHLTALRALYRSAEEVYERCAARRTITQYSGGMLIGVLLLLPVSLLNRGSFAVLTRVYAHSDNQGLFSATAMSALELGVNVGCVMGGLGAVSSVLLRITSSSVDMDTESTRHGLSFWANPAVQRGAARVVIGLLFGGVAAWLIQAGFLTPRSTGQEESVANQVSIAFTGTVAYVAGFSERFIPDLILRSVKERPVTPRRPGG